MSSPPPPPPRSLFNRSSPPPSPNDASIRVLVILSLLIVAAIVLFSMYFARKARRALVSELRAAVVPPTPSTAIQVWDVDAPTMEKFFHELAQEKPVRFLAQQLCSFTEKYSTVLGSGGFGKVYKGVFPNGIKIGVNGHVEQQFMAEVGTTPIMAKYEITMASTYL